MRADDLRDTAPLLHGAYLCIDRPAAGVPVEAIAAELGLRNEFLPGDGADSFGLIRRVGAAPGAIADERLAGAAAVVHVAAADPAKVDAFLARAGGEHAVLRGAVAPPAYTSNSMHDFAYAHRMLQQPGDEAPNAFLVPMRKTAAWWSKDWMERHTYFLPRYDEHGRMLAEGHALAAAGGIADLMRRTYVAADGDYEFLTYFECADRAVATFHAVCDALRDTARNPEWQYVREGPTWQGRRVRTWAELAEAII